MLEFPEILQNFTRAVEAGDGDAFAALFTEDGCYDDVFYGRFTGRDALAGMLTDHFHGHARDFRWRMHDPVSDGETGYAHYTFSYTSTMKHSAGRRVTFTGCSRFELVGEKIAAYREWAFATAGLAQLGAPPEQIARQAAREAARILSADGPSGQEPAGPREDGV